MFYCDDCAKENDYPTSIVKSVGRCELCGKEAICNDVSSSRLPKPKAFICDAEIQGLNPLTGQLGLDINPVGIPKDRFSRFVDTALFPDFPKRKKLYNVIDVPASGRSDWSGGARTLAFVYSKKNGNFVLRGYYEEVKEYLQKNYIHYFVNYTLWCKHEHRDIWDFWKDSIGIFTPTNKRRNWKYQVRPYSNYQTDKAELAKQTLKFKRLPKRWIPEFDQL